MAMSTPLNIFTKIKKLEDVPDPRKDIKAYNTLVFDEVEEQLTVAPKSGDKINLDVISFSISVGEIILHSEKLLKLVANKIKGASVTPEELDVITGLMRTFVNVLLVFYAWIQRNTPNATETSMDDWRKFRSLQDLSRKVEPKNIKQNVANTLANFDKDSMALLKSIFPKDHVDHFIMKEKYKLEDKHADLEGLMEDIEGEKTKVERERFHETRLRKRLVELMMLLPDFESRKAAIQNINSMLASNDIDLTFDVQKGGAHMNGGTDNLLPMFSELSKLFRGDDNPNQLLHENIKNTLLGLLKGTRLEAKIANLDGNNKVHSELLMESIKTGLLASITASMTAKKIADNVGKRDDTYQDSIAKIAVLTAIGSMLKAAGNTAESERINKAVEELKQRQESSNTLNTQLAMSSLLTTLKAAKGIDSNAKAEVTEIITRKLAEKSNFDPKPILASIIAILNTAKNTKEIKELRDQISSINATAASSTKAVDDGVAQQLRQLTDLLRQTTSAKEELERQLSEATAVAEGIRSNVAKYAEALDAATSTQERLAGELLRAKDDTDAAIQAKTAALQEKEKVIEEKTNIALQAVAALNSSAAEKEQLARNAKAAADAAQATSEAAAAKLEADQRKYEEMMGLQRQLIELMEARRGESAGGMGGGAGTADVASDPIAQAKKFRKELDEVKKTLRGITDAFGGLKGKYNKFHGTLPNADDRANFKAGRISDSKRVLGMYSYLNEEGRKFTEEVKNVVAEKKKSLVTSQENIQKILETEPTNPLYVKYGLDLKRTIEGDYDKTGEEAKGVLSQMDGVVGMIQTEYDENFSVLKSAAEGIKQEKEYAIREKQQQIAPQYAVVSNSSTNVKDDIVRAAKAKADEAIDAATSDKLKAIKANDTIQAAATDPKNEAVAKKSEELLKQIDVIITGFEADKKGLDTSTPEAAKTLASQVVDKAAKVHSLLKDILALHDKITNTPTPASSTTSSSTVPTVDEYFKNIDKSIGEVILKDIVQKMDAGYARKLNPALSTASGNEPTLFMTLWNNYLSDKDTSGQMVAAKKLTEALQANNLVPADILKLSMIDKAIFVLVMIVIRMITLSVVSLLIMRGKLRTLPWALGAFLFIYAVIYVGFVMFINLDMYRLRIIFNFLNLHGNSANIFLHLILMWLFSFVIFTVMWNINFPLKGTKITAISDEEKADLIYRLEVLTMIVWMFLVLMVLIAK